MTSREENKVNNLTSKFIYNELFLICKKLDSELSKLKNIVSISKSTISSLEKVYILEEINRIREKQSILIQSSSSSSYGNFDEPIKCEKM